jgi:dynein heavy chain
VRPDSLAAAVDDFVRVSLGPAFLTPVRADVAAVLSSGAAQHPVLFLLSAGMDPLQEIQHYAAARGVKLGVVSLGKGHGSVATRAVKSAAADGSWVVLMNCHLFTSWLPTLEHLFDEVVHAKACHADFRLILTSFPTAAFPANVLQAAVKVTCESTLELGPLVKVCAVLCL